MPELHPTNLAEWLFAIVLGAGAVAGALYAVVKLVSWGWTAGWEARGRRKERFTERIAVHVIREMQPILTQLNEINRRTEELLPNGGASLADAVNRVERQLDDLSGRFDAHVMEVKFNRGVLGEVLKDLEE